MNAYLVTLQPHELFFFGGEKTFGSDNANYFVKSRYFPQQTALLGLMRYQVLAAYGLLNPNQSTKKKPKEVRTKKALEYIGESSFNASPNQTFGKIAGISHLFLKNKNTYWNFAPKDTGFTYSENSIIGSSVVSNHKSFVPHIPKGFKYKEGITAQMISNEGISQPVKSFFKAHSQVGIGKNRSNPSKTAQTEEEKRKIELMKSKQFYKQTSYRFADSNMCFAFVVYFNEQETANKIAQHLQNNPNVFFGGERHISKMQMTPIEEQNMSDFWKSHQVAHYSSANQNLYKLILLSDAYAKAKKVYENCNFAVSEVVNFQHLISKVKHTDNYNNVSKKHENHRKVSRSNALNLLEKGSVFYCTQSQLEQLEEVFKTEKAFRKIGYNAFVTVNAKLETNFYQPENNQQNNDNIKQ